jgi:hypothetical protein
MAKTYLTPNGDEIMGTLERFVGRANIIGINEDGSPEYEGYTEVFWNDQVSFTRDVKTVFLDDHGGEWTFDQLVPQETTEEPDRDYLVSWSIDIEAGAANPSEAAAQALIIMRDSDPENTATVFTVTDKQTGEKFTVDLG